MNINMKQMMQQAQALQQKMQNMQNELENVVVEGEAAGGLVKVSITGKGVLKGVVISDTLMQPGEKEILEDLIIAAFNNAKNKADSTVNNKMQGMGLPPDIMGMLG